MRRNYPLTTKKNHFWIIGLLIILLTISCGVLELKLEDPQPNGAVTAPEDQSPIPEDSSGQQNPQQNTQPTNQPATTLNPTGPWLIFITGNSNYDTQIWAANPDGSAMTVLADNVFIGGIHEDYLLPQISPNGHYLAYIEIEEQPVSAFLHIVDLPSGKDKRIVQLYDESQIGYSKEILDVILYQASSLAWSPDGRRLAFIGAIEGETADLYVHVPDEESVTRVSDGPGQAYMPVWSQDGHTILHTATSLFHQGEGYSSYLFAPDGLWAYQIEEGKMVSVPWPFRAEPDFIRYSPWYESKFIFTFGDRSPCEDNNGCWLDVISEEKGSFPFMMIEYAISPVANSLLATSFNTTMPSDDAGTYLFTPENPGGRRLFAEELENIQWLKRAGLFAGRVITVPGLRLLQISASGELVNTLEWDFPGEYMALAASPDGKTAAWYRWVSEPFETGLWLGKEGNGMLELKPVFTSAVHGAVWTPDGDKLFFVVDAYNAAQADTAEGLYVVNGDGEGLNHLFVIPAENYLKVLGFAGE